MTKNKTIITAGIDRQDVFITREFDAPREIVFKAFTDPDLYVQWVGPRGLKMNLEKFEPRSGGSWRYTSEDKEGRQDSFHGVYHEVLFPERIIDTFEYENLPEKGHVALETAKFEELPGDRTKIVSQSVFQSVENRDGMIESDMEKGVKESYERLDELLEKMK